jgi:hypothetical protein
MGLVSDLTFNDPYGFYPEYALTYPDSEEANAYRLCYILASIDVECRALAKGYRNLADRFSASRRDYVLKHNIIFCLFYDLPFEDFSSQLQSFIIERNNPWLSAKDYALLFYISLQEAELKDKLEGLPLNMLYDMFMPVAIDKQNKWITQYNHLLF